MHSINDMDDNYYKDCDKGSGKFQLFISKGFVLNLHALF